MRTLLGTILAGRWGRWQTSGVPPGEPGATGSTGATGTMGEVGATTTPAGAPAQDAAAPTLFDRWLEDLFGGSGIDPRLQSVVIVVGAIVLAKLSDWFLTALLRKLAARTRVEIDDRLVEMLHRPVTRTIVVLGIALASKPLELGAPWEKLTERMLVTLAVLLWVPFAFRASTLVLRSASSDKRRYRMVEPRTFPLFDNLGKVLLFAGFTYIVLIQVWSLNPAGFLASAGIIGLAVSFAAQDTLSNLFAGVFIIADAPYRVGDFITLDSGERGEVLHIGLRSTRMLTRDDIEITIPNAVMGAAKITNEAGGPSTSHRIRVAVGVAYGSDIDRVREVLLEVAEANEDVLEHPEPRVRFRSFGESGLDFELLCWIPQPVLRGRTLDAMNCAVYKRFAEESIEIPYPKRDVFVHKVD